jgi:hypothetical protein
MIEANLSARILEMILNLKFAIAIGRYWSMEEASGNLGSKAIILELKPGRIQLEVKNSNTALITSVLMIKLPSIIKFIVILKYMYPCDARGQSLVLLKGDIMKISFTSFSPFLFLTYYRIKRHFSLFILNFMEISFLPLFHIFYFWHIIKSRDILVFSY